MFPDDSNPLTTEAGQNVPEQISTAPDTTSELQIVKAEITPELALLEQNPEQESTASKIVDEPKTIKLEATSEPSLQIELDSSPASPELQSDEFRLLEHEEETALKIEEQAESVVQTTEKEKEEEVKTEHDKVDVEKEKSEGVQVEGDEQNVESGVKRKSLYEDLEDFEKFISGSESHSSSFSLLHSEHEKEKEDEEEGRGKKKKKRKSKELKKDDKRVTGSFESDYSSLHMYTPAVQNIAGDFSTAEYGRKPKLPSISSAQVEEEEEEEEEEEKEEIVEKEEQITVYDRYQLYLTYDKLAKEYQEEKLKNNFLLSKLADYYKKRKMYYVLYEGNVHLDAQKKYEKQLDEYERINELNTEEITRTQNEINELRQKCRIKEEEAQMCFKKLQQDEHDVGCDIVNMAGHEEKTIERYLKRQKIQLSNLMKIRRDYIKIRNKVSETEEVLEALDNLGSNLHLIDYEQLKMDNRNLQDKLEEKEFELTKVRAKCENTMQILAHRREKAAALDGDIEYLRERLEVVNGEYEDVREQVNMLKQERDFYRSSIVKMKQEAGLLSKPKLLRDFSHTIEEAETLSRKVELIKSICITTGEKVKNLRKNMTTKKIEQIKAEMEQKQHDSATGMITIYEGGDGSSELTANS